jgi:hypothetical protein
VRLETDIIKIVYFDEGSATDYIQIIDGGALSTVETLMDEDREAGDISAGAKAGFSLNALQALIGLGASAKAEGSLESSFNSGTIAKSIISNTVLTDFLKVIDAEGTPIRKFENVRIEQIPGSISSFSLLTPYFSMLKPGQAVAAGDYDISLDKLDSTLSKAKGYLEFKGCQEGEGDVILRFNRMALKNNYRPSDLLKMNLTLYAVHVGECRTSDLVADKELSAEGFAAADNPDYTEEKAAPEIDEQPELMMYDVLLAGVSSNGN